MTAIEITKEPETSRRTTATHPRIALIIPWALVAVLVLSNVASVLNERVHNAAFGILSAIAGIPSQVVADYILSRSPARARTRAVDNATRQLQSENAALQNKNRSLHAEHEAIKASKAVLTKEHDALRAISAKRASAVRALATRTSTVLAARSAEAVATLPVRAAPYVGIAALVGFTTMELKADCDLARALAALNAEHGNEPVDPGQVCKAAEMIPTPQQAWSSVKAKSGAGLRATYDALESAANHFGLTIYSEPLK